MAAKKEFFKEVKESFLNWKITLKTVGKDAIFWTFTLLLFILFTLIFQKNMPQAPSFTPQTIYLAQPQELDAVTSSLDSFFTLILGGAIIGGILILSAFIFTKEWVWAGIAKTKINYKKLPISLGINLIIYAVSTIIVFSLMMLSGLLFRQMIYANFSQRFLQAIAILLLIILVPAIMQIINYSSYTYIKKRKFVASLIEPLKSFGKIRYLLTPYAIILVTIAILGYLFNFLIGAGIIYLRILGLLVLLYTLAWSRIYSYSFFERIYQK